MLKLSLNMLEKLLQKYLHYAAYKRCLEVLSTSTLFPSKAIPFHSISSNDNMIPTNSNFMLNLSLNMLEKLLQNYLNYAAY